MKVILKALYDVNLPKFVNDDIALFKVMSLFHKNSIFYVLTTTYIETLA